MYPRSHAYEVKQLSDKVKSVRFAMFTTTDRQGHLTATPMTNQDMGTEGDLWFLTSIHTGLWENIATMPEVNVSFAEPKDGLYVSVSGRAERVVERARVHELWNPLVQAWFPNGPEDPHVVLVRVVPHRAEYWDTASSRMVSLFALAKTVLTGDQPDAGPGEHRKIDLEPGEDESATGRP